MAWSKIHTKMWFIAIERVTSLPLICFFIECWFFFTELLNVETKVIIFALTFNNDKVGIIKSSVASVWKKLSRKVMRISEPEDEHRRRYKADHQERSVEWLAYENSHGCGPV